MTYISAKDKAKLIREELKKAFPGTKFSVRLKPCTYDSSVAIRYTGGPSEEKVERIAWNYQKIDRDERSGEILSGGNTYINVVREIPQDFKQRIRDELRAVYRNIADFEIDQMAWRKIREMDI